MVLMCHIIIPWEREEFLLGFGLGLPLINSCFSHFDNEMETTMYSLQEIESWKEVANPLENRV